MAVVAGTRQAAEIVVFPIRVMESNTNEELYPGVEMNRIAHSIEVSSGRSAHSRCSVLYLVLACDVM